MMKRGWKGLFKSGVMNRGKMLSCWLIENFKEAGCGRTADVSDGKVYTAFVSDDYLSMSCSCGEYRCAHTAAVLCYAAKLDRLLIYNESKITQKAKREVLRARFIKSLAAMNERNKFSVNRCLLYGSSSFYKWKERICELETGVWRKDGTITEEGMEKLVTALVPFFYEIYSNIDLTIDDIASDMIIWLYNKVSSLKTKAAVSLSADWFLNETEDIFDEIISYGEKPRDVAFDELLYYAEMGYDLQLFFAKFKDEKYLIKLQNFYTLQAEIQN